MAKRYMYPSSGANKPTSVYKGLGWSRKKKIVLEKETRRRTVRNRESGLLRLSKKTRERKARIFTYIDLHIH